MRRFVTRIHSASRFALDALFSARLRALLALLGIAIGVAAVVTLVALGQGLERQAQNDFNAMGTQMIDVVLLEPEYGLQRGEQPIETPVHKRMKWDALLAAVAALPEVELVSPEVAVPCSGSADQNFMVSAVSPELERVLGLSLSSGRFIHRLDGHEIWVVLGAKTARQLANKGQMLYPGAVLSLCGHTMRLAGVLEHGNVSAGVVSISLDDGIFVSTIAGERMVPGVVPRHLVLRVRQDVSPMDFEPQLAALINKLSGQTTEITTARQVLELRRTQAQSTTRFLAALSSLSLFVGSLGILNVMLMSVLERRAEIGLRMSIGADDIDIGLQFLAESMLLGLAGGGVGLIIGVCAAWVIASAVQLPFVLTVSGLFLAFGISLFVGMAAGLFPALKATKLKPVEALQSVR